ncbi:MULTISPECIES: flagellar biosynthetic protein FliO [unclassified Candidatus Neoarthromitus]|nr:MULTISPECIES: flagellar biosynthetic protein FliO [unclassified Candidatus Arthromitus]EGX28437.1 flagellar biosynthesis protein [Candidatus Arthromitus sp. SFB-mouse-NYU]BAK80182.1 putative flagellar biosynthesis protein FliZ [Candidatus Arthromitus sp. SFB-mouse-Yit]
MSNVMNVFSLILILVILMLIYVKLNFKGIQSQNLFIKVISRVAISKDNYILIIRVIDKYYLCSSTQRGINVIEHLDESKVLECMNNRKSTFSEGR